MLKRYQKQLEYAIVSFGENHRDELTHLYNRKLLNKKKKQLDLADMDYAVFYFDIV